ncbi:MAG: hypothetical protein ACRCT2_09775 [Plesiomonas shigelloides]
MSEETSWFIAALAGFVCAIIWATCKLAWMWISDKIDDLKYKSLASKDISRARKSQTGISGKEAADQIRIYGTMYKSAIMKPKAKDNE